MIFTILPTKIGTVGGNDVIALVHSDALSSPLVKIKLTSIYDRKTPIGWPTTPPGADLREFQPGHFNKVLPVDTIMFVTKAEADALIAAGAAIVL